MNAAPLSQGACNVSTSLNEIELAARWAMSPKTLLRWRSTHRGPKYLKLGKKVQYPLTAIGGCARFCVNGQSPWGLSPIVRQHNEHQEQHFMLRSLCRLPAAWQAEMKKTALYLTLGAAQISFPLRSMVLACSVAQRTQQGSRN